MTLKEFKNGIRDRKRFAELNGLDGLVGYYETTEKTFMDLWKNGTTTDFDMDFLKFVNGYQINNGEYEDLHILQTLDLWRITASRKVVKNMMEVWMNA